MGEKEDEKKVKRSSSRGSGSGGGAKMKDEERDKKREKLQKAEEKKAADKKAAEKPKKEKDEKEKAKDRMSSAGSRKSRKSSAGGSKAGSAARQSSVSDFTSAHGSASPDAKPRGRPQKRNQAMLRSPAERHPIGSALFQEQAEVLRYQGLASTEHPHEERHRCKSDVQTQLEVVCATAEEGLKMCGSQGHISLLEEMIEEVELVKQVLDGDDIFQEEVRFKHCKMHDLCDETREYPAASLQKDLIRNREIRTKCNELIRGGAGDKYVVDADEMDELVRVRNSIRTWYGGQNNLQGVPFEPNQAKNVFEMRPSQITISTNYRGLPSEFVKADDGPLVAGALGVS